jgi:hypothetical protein
MRVSRSPQQWYVHASAGGALRQRGREHLSEFPGVKIRPGPDLAAPGLPVLGQGGCGYAEMQVGRRVAGVPGFTHIPDYLACLKTRTHRHAGDDTRKMREIIPHVIVPQQGQGQSSARGRIIPVQVPVVLRRQPFEDTVRNRDDRYAEGRKNVGGRGGPRPACPGPDRGRNNYNRLCKRYRPANKQETGTGGSPRTQPPHRRV